MEALQIPHLYLDGLLRNGVGDCMGRAEAALHPLKTATAAQRCRRAAAPEKVHTIGGGRAGRAAHDTPLGGGDHPD